MGILFAFAPFLVFVIVERLVGVPAGLAAGALTSLGILGFDILIKKKSLKILEAGTFILFGGLTAYSLANDASWSIVAVRLLVDMGLLLIVLISLVIRRPFTLAYARDEVDASLWETKEFVKTNYVITGVWALAFLVMVLADLVLIYIPELPPKVGILTTIAAIVVAVKFTGWYPTRGRSSRQTGAGQSSK